MANINKSKASTLNAIFKNKNLRDLIIEGHGSTIGSTKREKAKSILKTLGKVNGVPAFDMIGNVGIFNAASDGQGGIGDMISGNQNNPWTQQPIPSQPTSSQNMSVAPKQVPQYNPQGQSPFAQNMSVEQPNKVLFIPPAPPVIQATPFAETLKSTGAAYAQGLQQIPPVMAQTLDKIGKAMGVTSDIATYLPKALGHYFIGTPAPTGVLGVVTKANLAQPLTLPAIKTTGTAPTTSKPTTTPKPSAGTNVTAGTIADNGNGTYTYVNRDGTSHVGKWGDGYVDKTTGSQQAKLGVPPSPLTTGTTPTLTPQETSSAIDDYVSGNTKSIVDAVLSSPGKTAFFNKLMSDKDLLQKAGFPAGTEPMGASLSDSIQDLYDSLQTEYGLNTQLDKINEMKKVGANIQPTLESYIRGKDTYLKDIQSMEDKARKAMFTSVDMSDPQTAKLMNNYMNYLTILKGRQTQRYVNFLNDAIDENNTAINNEIETYNANLEKFNMEFKLSGAKLEENYNNIKAISDELYDSIANKDKLTLENLKYQADSMKAASDIIKYTKELYGNNTAMETYSANKSQIDPILEAGSSLYKSGTSTDTKGTPMFNGNLGASVVELANQGIDANGLIAPLKNQIKDNGYNFIGDSNSNSKTIDDYFNNYSNVIMQYYNNYSKLTDPDTGEVKDVPSTVAVSNELINTLLASFQQYYGEYLRSTGSSNVSTIKSAMKALVAGGLFKKSATLDQVKAKKDEWYKNYSTSLPTTVLDAIYNMVTQTAPGNFSNLNDIFTTVDTSGTKVDSIDKLTTDQILNEIMIGIGSLFPPQK